MNIHLQNISRYLIHLIYVLRKCRTLTDYRVSSNELHPYKHIEARTTEPDMNNLSVITSSDNPWLSYGETHQHKVKPTHFTDVLELQNFTNRSKQGGVLMSYWPLNKGLELYVLLTTQQWVGLNVLLTTKQGVEPVCPTDHSIQHGALTFSWPLNNRWRLDTA